MKKILTTFVVFLSMFVASIAFAAPNEKNEKADEKSLSAAYYEWVKEVTTAKGRPEGVLKLYAKDALLFPTLQTGPLRTPETLRLYFVGFTGLKDLSAETDKLITKATGDFGLNSGLYTFSFVRDGKPVSVSARFTFVYQKQKDGKWLIIKHHSSASPETSAL